MNSLIHSAKYQNSKDAGAVWGGHIPAHWKIIRLRAILQPTSVKSCADYPLLSITREAGVILRDIESAEENHNFIPDDLSNYKLLKEGQFGMNKMKAWQGSYGISCQTGIVSPAYYTFNLYHDICPEFFHQAIRSDLYISCFASASDGVRVGQWDLSKTRMKEIPFLVPPRAEQLTIANFLRDRLLKIGHAIQIKEHQIGLLKERKQILIQQAVTCGLNPAAPMRCSGIEWIGEIPAHWTLQKVKYLSSFITSGPRGWSELFSDNGAYFLQSGNLNEDMGIELDGAVRVNPKSSAEGLRTRLQNNDVLLCITGAKTGKASIAEGINEQEVYINQHLALIRPSVMVVPKYLALALYSRIGQTYFFLQQYGLKQGLSLDDVKGAFVFVPPKKEQEEIVSYVDSQGALITRGIALLEQQITKLKEYKATLINSAVTGKIKVPGVVEPSESKEQEIA